MIFIYKVRKYAGQNILAIKNGLLVPHILHLMLPVLWQTIYWWKTWGHSVFDESPHCVNASSCITCAEVAVAPVVTLHWFFCFAVRLDSCSFSLFVLLLTSEQCCAFGEFCSLQIACVCVEQLHIFCVAVLWVYMISAPCVHSAAEVEFWTGFGFGFFNCFLWICVSSKFVKCFVSFLSSLV